MRWKRFRFGTLWLLLVALLGSCGHKTSHGGGEGQGTVEGAPPPSLPERQLASPEFQQSQEQAIRAAQAQAKVRLQSMVEEAQKLGKEAEEYLVGNLFLKASQASLAGDYESSALVYESIIQLSDDPYIALKYGMDLIRLGRVTEALLVLEKYYPRSGHYWEKFSMLLGGIYHRRKREKLAAQIYGEVLARRPGHLEACLYLSQIDFQRKRAKQAFETLGKCQRDNPKKGIFSYQRGKMHLSLDEIQRAQEWFQKSLHIEPTFYQSTLALGLILEDRGDLAGAIGHYQKLLQHWPTNRVILSRLVQSLLAMENYDQVIEYAQRLVFLDPSDLNLKVKLAILHRERGNHNQAIKLLQEVVEEVPKSDKVLYYLASVYQEIKQYEKSIEFFSRVPMEGDLYLESSVQVAKMLSALAIEEGQAEHESRLMDFIAQRSKNSSQVEVQLQVIRGQYYELTGRIEKGIQVIERVASRPEFNDDQRYYLASLLDRMENYDRSIALVEEILSNDAKNAHAWNFIGYSYLERDVELAKAYQYIRKAVELSPQDGYIRDSLGWYFYKVGKLDSALKELQLAYQLVGDDSTITKHLALVYEALNRYDLAKDFYVKTLGLVKEQSERDEVLQFIRRLDGDEDWERGGRHPASRPSDSP